MNTPPNSGTCQASDAAEIQVQLWTAILALTVYIRVAIPVHMHMLVSWILASRVAGGYPSLFNALLLMEPWSNQLPACIMTVYTYSVQQPLH